MAITPTKATAVLALSPDERLAIITIIPTMFTLIINAALLLHKRSLRRRITISPPPRPAD